MPTAPLTLLAELSQTTSQVVWGILWGGMAVLTLSLLILMQTRWGQARPVSKCVVLSVFAHLLLMTYAQVTNLFAPPMPGNSVPVNIRLSHIEFEEDAEDSQRKEVRPWDQLAMSPAPVDGLMTPLERMEVPELDRQTPNPQPDLPMQPQRSWDLPQAPPSQAEQNIEQPIAATGPQSQAEIPATPVSAKAITPPATAPATNQIASDPSPVPMPRLDRVSQPMPTVSGTPMPTEVVQDRSNQLQMLRDAAMTTPDASALPGERDQLLASTNQLEAMARGQQAHSHSTALDATLASLKGNQMQELWASRMAARHLPIPRATRTRMDTQPLPLIMQARVVEDSAAWIEMMGGSKEIEPAVNAALEWLVSAQEEDGRWDAVKHGAGRENQVAGHNRQGAGNNADMGITGLATLAFLAKGHTHLDGEHRVCVQKALEYLVNHQQQDGCLGGQAGLYAKMYCHAMALLAISEAYAMTKDERIRPFLDRGLAYTISAQHPTMGGWRYHPGDRGDMSQFGWQVLALHSAALSGIEIDQQTRELMTRFLNESSSGPSRGLAAYRPGEKASPTMTAEALTCRFFLGIENSPEQIDEAARYVIQNEPTRDEIDLYYCYYGTLSMYQMQDESWKRWADRMQPKLLQAQNKGGEFSGSWNPECRWGGYGGRVYSTAMATLSLEVYFRYLPIYRKLEVEEPRVAEKPATSVAIPR